MRGGREERKEHELFLLLKNPGADTAAADGDGRGVAFGIPRRLQGKGIQAFRFLHPADAVLVLCLVTGAIALRTLGTDSRGGQDADFFRTERIHDDGEVLVGLEGAGSALKPGSYGLPQPPVGFRSDQDVLGLHLAGLKLAQAAVDEVEDFVLGRGVFDDCHGRCRETRGKDGTYTREPAGRSSVLNQYK